MISPSSHSPGHASQTLVMNSQPMFGVHPSAHVPVGALYHSIMPITDVGFTASAAS